MNARELTAVVAELVERADGQRRELDAARAAQLRTGAALAGAHRDSAVLRARPDDVVKRQDALAGRAWTLVALLVGAALSLAAGLVAALARK